MRDLLTEFEREEIVVECLDAWAQTTPDAVYLYYGEDDRTLTFGEVAELTDRIAGNLVRLGVSRGQRVSLLMQNPLVTTLAMFGIWKAGAVFCPINYTFTGKLLAYTLNDTQPTLLLTERRMAPRLTEIAAELTHLPHTVVYDAPEGAHDYLPPTERMPLPDAFHPHAGRNCSNQPHVRTSTSSTPTQPASSTPPGQPAPPKGSSSPSAA